MGLFVNRKNANLPLLDVSETPLTERPLKRFRVSTRKGRDKWINLACGSYESLDLQPDVLIVSAFKNDYTPVSNTMIGCLWQNYDVSVAELAKRPVLNMKDFGVWVSDAIGGRCCGSLACVELIGNDEAPASLIENLFFALKKHERRGGAVASVAMPLLGTGNQGFDENEIVMPLLSECIEALESIDGLHDITIFTRRDEQYEQLSKSISNCLPRATHKTVFISYSHKDADFANSIASTIEQNGIKAWMDHRKIRNPDYAEEIIDALRRSTAYAILVSSQSMQSTDVLRELRNAGELESAGTLKIYPLLLERIERYPSAYSYYLSGHEWFDLSIEPMREKIEKFCAVVAN